MIRFTLQKTIIDILFLFYIQRKGTQIVLWTEEQELELQMLFEEYKDSDGNRHFVTFVKVRDRKSGLSLPSVLVSAHFTVRVVKTSVFTDILGNILKKITAKRSRARIVDKLLSLGLVSERRELYKKRSRSAHGKSAGRGMVAAFEFLPLKI